MQSLNCLFYGNIEAKLLVDVMRLYLNVEEKMKKEIESSLHLKIEKAIYELMEKSETTKLMPEKDLAEYFNVSRTTIREALNNMEKKSLIKKRKGHGNFMLRSVINDKMALNIGGDFAHMIERAGFVPYLTREFQNYNYPNKKIRDELFLTPEDMVVTLKWVFYADDIKAVHILFHIPKKLMLSFPEDGNSLTSEIDQISTYRTHFGQQFSHVIAKIKACENNEMTKFFNLERDTPLIMFDEIAYNIFDVIIGSSEIYLNPQIMNLSLILNLT